MVYKFIDVNEVNLKSYASIQTIIDGFNLDEELEGYRTLNVSGRSVFGRDIQTLKYNSQKSLGRRSVNTNRGVTGQNKFFGSNIQSIEIEVEFRLEAKSNRDFRKRLSKLAYLLHGEEKKWSFTDDPFFHYIGTLADIGTFKEDKNCIISTFKILCTDPLKTSNETYSLKGTGRKIHIPEYDEDTEIKSLRLSLNESTKTFRFDNSLDQGKTILTDPKGFNAGDIFFVNFEKMLITKNGLNAMTKLDLTSDFESFFIAPDEYINLSSPCEYEVKYKLRSF